MPLNGLGQFTPEEFEEATKDKKPLKIRISLFFDGTLNNRDNIEEREMREFGKSERTEHEIKPEIEEEDYSEFTEGETNSYQNGRTNIAIMEPHVSVKKDDYSDYDFVYKHYVAGQGTFSHDSDSFWGYALGSGDSGVASRAEDGISKAVNSILEETTKIKPEKHYIEKLLIDVFGFSRGAATARYAIHVVFEGRISWVDEDTGQVFYEWDPVVKRLNDFNYATKNESVEVGFAGLYDTVLSYFGSQYVSWSSNTLKQKAVAEANKSLHLAAADEHRNDFPLHKISSAIKKGKGEEYFLPGVHADVGGSYNQANDLLIEIQNNNDTEESEKEYMRPSGEGSDDEIERSFWLGEITSNTMVINKGDPDKVEKDRQDLINQGWYLENEIKAIDVSRRVRRHKRYVEKKRAILTVNRQGISSAYSNIPLKVMAKFSRGEGVKLVIDSKLEDRADIILSTDEDLGELEKIIEQYISSNKNNSKPEDWKPEDWLPIDWKLKDKVGKKAKIEIDLLKKIRHNHFHFSASKLSTGYKPNFEWDENKNKYVRKRYYYNG